MVGSRRKNLDDVRVIHRRGGARLLFEPADLRRIGAQLGPEKLERDETIQPGVARLVNRTHPADSERFQQSEVIESALDPHFFSATGTGNPGQRFFLRNIDEKPAGGATLARIILGGHLRHLRGL